MDLSTFVPATPVAQFNEPLRPGVESGTGQLVLDPQGDLMIRTYRFRSPSQNLIDTYNGFVFRIPEILREFELETSEGWVTLGKPHFVMPSTSDPQLGQVDLDVKLRDNPLSRKGISPVLTQDGVSVYARTEQTRAILPFEARRRNRDYSSEVFIEARLEPKDPNVEPPAPQKIFLGLLPTQLGSILCHLNGMTPAELADAGEDPNDPLGYFITNGQEKVIITQQHLSYNRILVIPGKGGTLFCRFITPSPSGTHQVEVHRGTDQIFRFKVPFLGKGNMANALYPFVMMGYTSIEDIMSFFEPFIPEERFHRFRNLMTATLADLTQNPNPEQVIIHNKYVERKSQIPSPAEVRDAVILDLFPAYRNETLKLLDQQQGQLDGIEDLLPDLGDDYMGELMKEAIALRDTPESIFVQTAQPSLHNLFEDSLEELEELDDLTSEEQQLLETGLRIRKRLNEIQIIQQKLKKYSSFRLHTLALMISRVALVYLSSKYKPDDWDSWSNKALVTAGTKVEELFTSILKSHVERLRRDYSEQPSMTFETLARQLNGILTKDFTTSLSSGRWGVGNKPQSSENIVQTPSRISLNALIADLRLINKPANRKGTQAGRRESHPDQLKFVCYVKTPEGQNCGLLEGIATMALVSLDRPEGPILSIILGVEDYFSEVRSVLANSPVFLNGRMIGWGDARRLRQVVLNARRSRQLPFDILAVILNDILYIHSDRARMLAPVLRVNPETGWPYIDEIPGARQMIPEELLARGIMEYVGPLELSQTDPETKIVIAESYDKLKQQAVERANNERQNREILAEMADINQETQQLSGRNQFSEDIFEASSDPAFMEWLAQDSDLLSDLQQQLKLYQENLETMSKPANIYTHIELDPSGNLGHMAGLAPNLGSNAAPRNAYVSKHFPQMLGIQPRVQERFDTTAQILMYPQMPITQTQSQKTYNVGENPSGNSVLVMVGNFLGMNQEDAFVINSKSADLGTFWTVKHFSLSASLNTSTSNVSQEKFGLAGLPIRESEKDLYHAIKPDGSPREGAYIRPGECVIAKMEVNNVTGKVSNVSVKMPAGKEGYVRMSPGPEFSMGTVVIKVSFEQVRRPITGQKLSVGRSGQKGTIGVVWPESMMPVDEETGERPTIVINPHSVHKRMTISLLIEILGSSAGVVSGNVINGTSFRPVPSNDYKKILVNHGYRETGKRVMRSGIDGSRIISEMFMGICQTEILKHQAQDKATARARGRLNIVTRQPVGGRAFDGGVRVGEMEVAALLAWGATGVLMDRTLECSDAYQAVFCSKCGTMAQAQPSQHAVGGDVFGCRACQGEAEFGLIQIPFTLKHLQNLLAGTWIKVSLDLRKQSDRIKRSEVIDERQAQTVQTGRKEFMTPFERSRYLATRAKQLDMGDTPLVEVGSESDSLEIARMELKQGKGTLMIRRILPSGEKLDIPLTNFSNL